MSLETKFNHIEVEKNKYKNWVESGLFTADASSDKEAFSIVLPPPNVTGKLHLGHAWDGTLQDILIRYKKMNGFETMWIAGMDHAGIATQAKVEERIRELGIDRDSLTREDFLNYAWEWKEEYATTIREQWGKMGFALDYSREKFTLDTDVSNSVKKVFVTLYNEGLIYQGTRITNWDPVIKTAISDIEVIYKEVEGNLYYLKYFLEDGSDYITVATTRPETIFADVAICVHPEDERFKHLHGKKVINPGNKQLLPIITDTYVDMEFGTGCLKITPAHDPNDYLIGIEHKLEMPLCIELNGTMSPSCGKYAGTDRFDCRQTLIHDLTNEDLVVKVEAHMHNVGHSERSGCVVEPILSKQWFVSMKELANRSIENQKNEERIEFFPERFESTFLTWMENIQDWCISRQLWWGHQIPVYYHNVTGEIVVSEENPGSDYTQDKDVLDTWFSSALWPFTTTIWSDNNENMEKFFPTDVLVTGYDIIFFWVSRMIFQSLKFTDQKPFDDVLIHGLIRAEDGRKMSKSLGNGIDPMDVIESHGADALRFFLTTNSSPGQDLRFSSEKLDSAWNFINKLWNITRYVDMNTEVTGEINPELFDIADQYIINRLNETITQVDTMMEKYEFGIVAQHIYNFAWDDFASWYLETTKYVKNDNKQLLLKYVNLQLIKLLHPFMPFVTTEIFETLTDEQILDSWPKVEFVGNDDFEFVKEVITSIRNFKAENDLKPSTIINVNIDKELCSSSKTIIENMAKAIVVEEINGESIAIVLSVCSMNIENNGLINNDEKIAKLNDQLAKNLNEIKRSLNMLSNEKFVSNANEAKLKAEFDKARNYISQYYETTKLLGEMEVEVSTDTLVTSLEGIINEQ